MSWKNKQRDPVNCHSSVFSGSIMVGWVTMDSISVLETLRTWAEVLHNYHSWSWKSENCEDEKNLEWSCSFSVLLLTSKHYAIPEKREVLSLRPLERRLFTKLILRCSNKNINLSVSNLSPHLCICVCTCVYVHTKLKYPCQTKPENHATIAFLL